MAMESVNCTGWSYEGVKDTARKVCPMPMQDCTQFCSTFDAVLPYTYLGVSVVSAICCMLVFLTYLCMPRLRQTGYSSKVFLNR